MSSCSCHEKTGHATYCVELHYVEEFLCEAGIISAKHNDGMENRRRHNIAGVVWSSFDQLYRWPEWFKSNSGTAYRTTSGVVQTVGLEEMQTRKYTNLPPRIAAYEFKDILTSTNSGYFMTIFWISLRCYRVKPTMVQSTARTAWSCLEGPKWMALKCCLVGTAQKPQCFRHVQSLPCIYTSNRSAWMTYMTFEDYLGALDAKTGSKNRKNILFIDHCPANTNSPSKVGNICIESPPSTTAVLEPIHTSRLWSSNSGRHWYVSWFNS